MTLPSQPPKRVRTPLSLPCSRQLGARLALLGLSLTLSAVPTVAAAQQSPQAGNQAYDYDYRLPLWGDRLAKRGITFPLPVGVGLNYAFIDQPITIDSLQLAVNDSQFVNLDNIVKFKSVDARAQGLNARFDVWLLPFFNVYGLFNYIPQAKTDVRLSEPFELKAGAEQSGGGGGVGTTLAMGAWGFFGTIDFNWTRNKMEKLDAPVSTYLLTPRDGRKIFRKGKIELTAWLGTMFQNIGVDTSGKIKLSEALGEPSDEAKQRVQDWYDGLPPARQAAVRGLVEDIQDAVGDPVIRYKLNKRVTYPWNMVVGSQLELTPNWQLRVEVGFINRLQVMAGINYRFGLVKMDRAKQADPG